MKNACLYELHLHKKIGYGIVFMEMLTITETRVGKPALCIEQAIFVSTLFIRFLLPLLTIKQGFYAE